MDRRREGSASHFVILISLQVTSGLLKAVIASSSIAIKSQFMRRFKKLAMAFSISITLLDITFEMLLFEMNNKALKAFKSSRKHLSSVGASLGSGQRPG